MTKEIQITKKLSLRLHAHKFRSSFTFIAVYIDRFIDYQLVLEFLNMKLTLYYVNTKQQEALKRLHENLGNNE
jgi:hypothetical protein